MEKTLLVTGGAGFIGSCFVLRRIAAGDRVVTLDRLTYCGRKENLADVLEHPRHTFVEGDIADVPFVARLLKDHAPDAVVHFAAETHVDRSIAGPEAFVRTNVNGTVALLDAVTAWWRTLGVDKARDFRFHHVSTDEVFGALGPNDAPFTEASPYAPNSPYSASKAASDHFVRAYGQTYGLPVLITHCSNNYGPRQFPEKLIPHMITRALAGETLPVYGNGANVRDWLYVDDHCAAIDAVLEKAAPGSCYVIGGDNECDNLTLVRRICVMLDRLRPLEGGRSYAEQIEFVADRPGHDFRYAIDASRIRAEVGWRPETDPDEALERTVRWYVETKDKGECR